MRIGFSILALALLASCATPAGYEKQLGRWIGADEPALVRAWGAPRRVQEAGGARFVTFVAVNDFHVSGNPPESFTPVRFADASSMLTYPGGPGHVVRNVCETTFELRDARVVSWSWRGDDCRAAG